jgi:hypothetical protein
MNPTNSVTRTFLISVAVTIGSLSFAASITRGADDSAVPLTRFPQPDRVRYDGHCMIIDGKDVFIFSSAFHYFRCPRELWHDRFTKIKEAGFNAVETYAAWNWSERDEPKDLADYSHMDVSDFQAWLKMAHEEFGLYTIVRPGPYICAEWTGGGFPRWLADKKDPAVKGNWLRTDDPTYLAWSKHWFDAVCRVIAPEQLTKKPKGSVGTILFQIENEYDFFPGNIVGTEARKRHLQALYKMAREDGIDVPVFTCWTGQGRGSKDPILSQVFDASNFYSRWAIGQAYSGMIEQKQSHPDAPGMVSELQGGWFAGVGDKLAADQDGVTAQQCAAITLDVIDAGGTILNYYMGFGGTNFGDWNARGITTTYDYAAPIRECGGVDEKYRYVAGIGRMLQKVGPLLARSDRVGVTTDNRAISVGGRRAAAGDLFLFYRNPDHRNPAKGAARLEVAGAGAMTVNFDLEPFGSRVLYFAPGVFDPAKAEMYPQLPPPIERPAVPPPVRIASAMSKVDTGGEGWVDFAPPRPKVAFGVNNSYFSIYQATLPLTADQVAKYSMLRLERYEDDPLIVQVNGQIISSAPGGSLVAYYDIASQLKAGDNKIVVLYDDPSQANFGDVLENVAGLKEGALVDRESLGRSIENWRVKIVPSARKSLEVAADFDDSSWDSFVLNDQTIADLAGVVQPGGAGPKYPAAGILNKRKATAVFRSSVDVTDEQIKAGATKLTFDCLDDIADVYVNGTLIGHSDSWRHPYTFDASAVLKAGKNSLAVVVTNIDGGGGITKAVHLTGQNAKGLALDWKFAPTIAGQAGEWSKPDLATAGWQTVELDSQRPLPPKGHDAPTAKTDALVTWYRAEFELPASDPKTWIPWKANIDAAGNGFIYLNGHPLGRYYDVGPQREYYLPECWLNFGPGAKNVLTTSLRPTEHGALLRALQVEPYAEYAEKRDMKGP